ncbi:hypothetical protein J2S46_008098 [Kitasatospora herbaricolor]|uniref:hypothetical protein n=1 Tax=Kitasatospora herbaricolor TaxID=68217 RepID=UPI00174923AA|nr:hypothetical protein [Kitasatospora herbaricolor]MDQ0313445.1 hypothetical protein [Kitasatospora herbaricolor]
MTADEGYGNVPLGPSKNDPTGAWYEHYVVEKDGAVYDAFTGSGGMPMQQFRAQWDFSPKNMNAQYLSFTAVP